MSTIMLVSVLVFVCILVGGVTGHSYGADLQSCDTMKPSHGGNVRRTTRSPFVLETNMLGYVPCQTQPLNGQFQMNCGVIVRIRSRPGSANAYFKGFLLQARSRMQGGQIVNVGEFRYLNGQQILVRNNQLSNQVRTNPLLQAQFAGRPVQMGQQGRPFPGRKRRQVNPQFNPAMNPAMNPAGNRFGNTPFGNNQFGTNQFGSGGFGQMNQFGMQMQAQTGGGTMINSNNVQVQRLNCQRGFTVTHTENNLKNMVQMVWYPPVGFNRKIEFVATVVRDFNTFWMGHRSRTLNARPRLRTAGALTQTGRWYSSATRPTSGIVLLMTSICTLLFLRQRS